MPTWNEIAKGMYPDQVLASPGEVYQVLAGEFVRGHIDDWMPVHSLYTSHGSLVKPADLMRAREEMIDSVVFREAAQAMNFDGYFGSTECLRGLQAQVQELRDYKERIAAEKERKERTKLVQRLANSLYAAVESKAELITEG